MSKQDDSTRSLGKHEAAIKPDPINWNVDLFFMDFGSQRLPLNIHAAATNRLRF